MAQIPPVLHLKKYYNPKYFPAPVHLKPMPTPHTTAFPSKHFRPPHPNH